MNYLIISAMLEESKELLKEYNWQVVDTFNNNQVYELDYRKNKYYLAISSIGKVNASATLTYLSVKYNIDYIFNIGSCGALSEEVKQMDFIIAQKTSYFDVDATAFDYEYGQLPKEERFFENKNPPKLVDIFSEKVEKVHCGLIVSGDSFVHSKVQKEEILNHFPKALALDMESAAFAQTSKILDIPLIVFRGVSDEANQTADIDFPKYLELVANKFKNFVKVIDEANI